MDLPNARSIRPNAGERDRCIAFLNRKADACERGGDMLAALRFRTTAEDIAKGLHE